jgi:hypothetical protein
MTGFSFDATAGASQSTARLVGNKIHTVQFKGCELTDIQGVKDPTQIYKVLKFKYGNEEGTYEHTIFEPREDDFKRGENEFRNKNGNVEKIPQASNVESLMLFFKHNIDAFVPAVAKAIDSGEKSLTAPDWDSLRKLIEKIMNSAVGATSKIKLITTSKGDVRMPGFFTGLTRDGKAYIKNNFIGERILFTPYEMKRIDNAQQANIKKTSNLDLGESDTSDAGLDLAFDVDAL